MNRRDFGARSPPGAWESFFKFLYRPSDLGMMSRTRRELTIAHGSQLAAHRLLGDDDAEFLEYPLAQVDDSPTNDAMHRGDRSVLDHSCDGRSVHVVQSRGLSGRLAIDEAVWSKRVELHHPVPDDLQRYAADLRRLT